MHEARSNKAQYGFFPMLIFLSMIGIELMQSFWPLYAALQCRGVMSGILY